MHGGFALTVWIVISHEVSLVIRKFDVIIFCYYGMKIQCLYRYYQLYKFVPHACLWVLTLWKKMFALHMCHLQRCKRIYEEIQSLMSLPRPIRISMQCTFSLIEPKMGVEKLRATLTNESVVIFRRPSPSRPTICQTCQICTLPCLLKPPPPPSSTISRYFHSIRLSLWNHSSR